MVNKVSLGFCAEDKGVAESLCGVDVAVFGFKVFGSISFKSELSGKQDALAEMGRLSAKLNAVCFFGVDTDSYGVKRRSVIACSSGRLLGVSDETRVKNGGSASSGYKIYNTNKGKIGILVGNDLFNVEAVRSLTNCECDLIVDVSKDPCDFRPDILTQAISYINGVAVCYMSGNVTVGAAPGGELEIFSESPVGKFNLPTKRKYSEIIIKSRGF